MAKCKSCGADIIWIKTAAGKSIPCDSDARTYWKNPHGSDVIVTPNGEVYKADLTGDLAQATGIGYISHFATCPAADKFRKKKEKKNA